MEIFDAITNDDISGVRRIIEEQDFDLNKVFNTNGYTPLHIAAELGYGDIISLLICHNADVNTRSNSDYEETPLHVAARSSFQSAQVLITHGADVSAQDTEGEQPIHDAARHNQHKIIELLLMVNADINGSL